MESLRRFTETPTHDEQIRIITETIEYYSAHPFGFDREHRVCTYRSSEGEKCAVGRLLTEQEYDFLSANRANTDILLAHTPISCVCQSLFGTDASSFWVRLQAAHDDAAFDHDTLVDCIAYQFPWYPETQQQSK